MEKICLTCDQPFRVSPSRKQIKNCSYICNKIWRKQMQHDKQQLYTFCGCGCEQMIHAYDKSNRPVKYILGHSPQMAKGETNSGSFKQGHIGLRGEKAPNWRGGLSLMRNGYMQIRVDGQRHYLHRYLMEQKLGRKLKTTAQVHHIDHDPLNNDLDNLMVLSPQAHAKYHSNVMWGNLTKGKVIV